MSSCPSKAIFVKFVSLLGNDKYIYPLTNETLDKYKNGYHSMEVVIPTKETYLKHHTECKFLPPSETTEDMESHVKYRLATGNNTNIFMDALIKDNNLIDLIEKIMLMENKLNKNYDEMIIKNHLYYDLWREPKKFTDIPLKKLKEKGYMNDLILSEAINKFELSIASEIDKYIPKEYIPNDKKISYKDKYDLVFKSEVDPRFAKYVIDNRLVDSWNRNLIVTYMLKKNWKQLLGSEFIYNIEGKDKYKNERLAENPCHVIFFPDDFHTEDNYIKAVYQDFEVYNHLKKEFITPKVTRIYDIVSRKDRA